MTPAELVHHLVPLWKAADEKARETGDPADEADAKRLLWALRDARHDAERSK